MSEASEKADPSRAYHQSIDDVVAALGTNVQHGLSDGEAESRLHQHGRNELLAEQPLPVWRRFLAQFQNVLVILLLVADGNLGWFVDLLAGRGIAVRGDRHLRGRAAQCR